MNSIFYDSLTANNGGWTIPAEAQSASSYNENGWRITSSSSNGTHIRLTALTMPDNFEIQYTLVDFIKGQNIRIGGFEFETTEEQSLYGAMYNDYREKWEIFGRDGSTIRFVSSTVNNGDVLRFKYLNGEVTLYINDTPITTHTPEENLSGSQFRIYMKNDRWLQIKDFTIKEITQ